MATVTIPSAAYNPSPDPYAFQITPDGTETFIECELQVTQWNAGRTVVMRVEHSNDGGQSWSHLIGGTWVGPQPGAFGNPFVQTYLLPVERRVNYALRGTVQLSGGSIRTAVRLTTG